MPVSQADIIALSSPIPVPTEMGDFRPQDKSAFTSKQQEVNAALSGVSKDPGVGLPFGDTGLIEKSGTSTSTGTTTTDFSGPIDVVGERVGGLVGSAPQDPDKYEAYIPEPKDTLAEDTDDFISADAGEGDFKMYDSKGEQITGKRAARGAKRADRRADRQARKDAKLTGSDKRRVRRAQRRNRKQSWQNYKGEMDLQAQDKLAELENI
tara:strand:- start:562 stop:1188 length:627 start_codon:yes stop_codon:yes gene_type:complete